MDDLAPVREVERRGHLAADERGQRPIELPRRLQEVAQIHAVDVLEHHQALRARLVQIEHRHDVAMHQRRGDARLLEQRLLQRLVELIAHDLEHHAPREAAGAGDLGEQHAPHAAFAERANDAIAPEVIAVAAHWCTLQVHQEHSRSAGPTGRTLTCAR